MIKDIANIVLASGISALPWADKQAGIVQTATRTVSAGNGPTEQRFPISCNVSPADCEAGGRYRDLIPDSRNKSVMYFEDINGCRLIRRDGRSSVFECDMRMVVWLNIQALGYDDCSLTPIIVASVAKLAPTGIINSGIYTKVRWGLTSQEPRTPQIFSRYTYNESVTQYLLYPYDYFALNIRANFTIADECINDFILGAADQCNIK